MSKEKAVIEYLKKSKKGITSWEAIEMFAATRLSAIIYNAKEKGYIIKDRYEEHTDKYGQEAPYKRYWIVGNIYDGEKNDKID